MEIQMFNFWYFFWIALSIGAFFGLYFFLKNKSAKTKKAVLFGLLVFALLLHFLKCFIPPYSTNQARLYRDVWFVNICGANIFLFPFIFLSKSKTLKDYMFYLGILGGGLALLLPLEPIEKVDQSAEWLDIVRFYLHHSILWTVPLLTVIFNLHELSYKRAWTAPVCLLGVMLFIMLNQIFQSELGFIPLRDDAFFDPNYKNTSYIWGPDDAIGDFLAKFCPKIFKTIPAGEFAGQEKYWPWFWLIVPAFVLLMPIAFGMSLIFDHKRFVADMLPLKRRITELKTRKKAVGERALNRQDDKENYL